MFYQVMKHGKNQAIETLLLPKYLRDEKIIWTPRLANTYYFGVRSVR
ncbi:hypothetical protein MCGE09_00416 [Thaumarchaeota archaeon SCGC AB-539-E09]|nr:hypothetical protein MCGE09_00416 [Thaumarchaeota archaeon SCGC AB-539-E09]